MHFVWHGVEPGLILACMLRARPKGLPDRELTVQALIDVAKVFGDAWTGANLVPAILQQLDEPFYLFRITCMQARSPVPSMQIKRACTGHCEAFLCPVASCCIFGRGT